MIFDIKLTNNCNSRCKFCHIWQERSIINLDKKIIFDIVDKYCNHEFVFSGGECLFHPDFYEIVRYCSARNVNFLILSNGLNLGGIKRAIYYGAKRITLSVDGYNHDVIRGVKGNLDLIRKIIEEFSKLIDIRLAYTVCDDNDLEKDQPLLKELISTGANKNVYYIIVRDTEAFNVKNSFKQHQLKIPADLDKFETMSTTSKKYLLSYSSSIQKCLSPQFYFSIFEDGNVRYCQSYNYNIILGNVNDKSIESIIEKSKWILSKSNNCAYKDECWAACHRRYDVKASSELSKIKGEIS